MASKGPKSDPVAVMPILKPGKSPAVPAALAYDTPHTDPVIAKPAPKPQRAPKPVVLEQSVAPEPVPTEIESVPLPATVPEVVPEAAPVANSAPPPVAPEQTVSTPAPAVAAAIVQKEVVKMEEKLQSATDTAQVQAQTLFADANDRTKAAMEKGSQMIEDMNAFSKGNIEALVESSKIAAKAIETLGQEAAEYGRKQFEASTAAMKTLATAKSPTEFMKLQGDFIRTAFDSMVAETSKNTETMLKLAGEIAQPLSNRVAVAAEKVKLAA